MSSSSRFRSIGLLVAIPAWLPSASCDNPPPPAAVTNPGGTFIEGFLDFGSVAVGTTKVEPLNIEPGLGVSGPALVHLDIESVPGDAASNPTDFSLLDAGVDALRAPCLVGVAFTPSHVAAANHALLEFWFTAPDGGILDRTGYLLRGTSVLGDAGSG